METVSDGLPYTYYEVSGDVGASDVVFLNGALHVLTGEGKGDALSRRVLRIPPTGPIEVFANIQAYIVRTTTMTDMLRFGGLASNPCALRGQGRKRLLCQRWSERPYPAHHQGRGNRHLGRATRHCSLGRASHRS